MGEWLSPGKRAGSFGAAGDLYVGYGRLYGRLRCRRRDGDLLHADGQTSKMERTVDRRVIGGDVRRHGEIGGVQQLGVNPAQVTFNARLVEDLDVSTFDMIAIIMRVEELASLTIPDADIQSFKTFGDIVKYVDANRV